VRVPDDLIRAEDAEIIVRIQTAATGKVEASRKLSELPRGKVTLGQVLGGMLRRGE
jgi:hypothetical protein